MVGKASGKMILNSMMKSFAPSIWADSTRLSGIPWNAVLRIIRFQVAIAPGMIKAHNESIKPRFLTNKKLGISPPPKNMVNTIMMVIGFL
ncbi:hypothetical protein D3C87_1874570 [compost metagenome]